MVLAIFLIVVVFGVLIGLIAGLLHVFGRPLAKNYAKLARSSYGWFGLTSPSERKRD